MIAICLTYTTVSWIPFSSSPKCGSVSYDVRISSSDGVIIINVTDTSYNFTGLTPNTNYNVTMAGDRESIIVGYHVPTSCFFIRSVYICIYVRAYTVAT